MQINNRYLRAVLLRTFFGSRLKKSEEQKFRREFDQFKQLADRAQPRFLIRWQDRYPVLREDGPAHGFDRHYIYHTAWAARKVRELAPACHVDISSSLYFASIVSAFIPIQFYDYRPARLELNNLTCGHADLLKLPFESESILSLSCMHVVEHIGLGRYGEPLNLDGDLTAMQELRRVLAPGGSLLFVAPVGQSLLTFNSHRVYPYEQVTNVFSDLKLMEFSLVPDDKTQPLIINADPQLVMQQEYGCGCFHFQKTI
jgi:SAM-dependent methyltransferase